MEDKNTGDSGEKLSGIRKYGKKMRERERDVTYTRPVVSSDVEKDRENDQTAANSSGNASGTQGNASPQRVRTVKVKTRTKQQSAQRFAREKNKSWKEKRDSRFSTHGRAAIITIFVILFIALAIFSAFLSYTYLVDRTESPIYLDEIELDPATTVKFKIEKGASTNDIVDKLEEMGLIKNSFMFRVLSKFNGYDSLYKSGVHYLSQGLTYDEIMTILSSDPLITKVTFPEGFTTAQIAERLEAHNVCKASEFLKAVNTVDVSSYGFLPSDKGERDYILDGYLFPDTYEFEIDSSPETVIYKLLNRFNEIFKTDYFARAEKLGLTVDQVVNLAAIVEKEAFLDSERETIAGVYYNRLNNTKDFGYMQSDATVLYSMKRNGDNGQKVGPEQRKIDDIYNTYMYPGLTPGPICNPSAASIIAVITMDSHDYYFYVLKSDGSGSHIFSRTLEEHKAAIASQTPEE